MHRGQLRMERSDFGRCGDFHHCQAMMAPGDMICAVYDVGHLSKPNNES